MVPWTVCFGANKFSQLGLGHTEYQVKPTMVDAIANLPLVRIAAAHSHTIFLDLDGNVHFCGNGINGIAGDENDDVVTVPTKIPSLSRCVHVATSDHTSLALTDDGAIVQWGWMLDAEGENFTSNPTPVSLPPALYLSCGYHFNVAVLEGGQVWGWGMNDNFQLGRHKPAHAHAPVRIPVPKGFRPFTIASGRFHSVALSEDGTVVAWGRNLEQQVAPTLDQALPPTVVTLPDLNSGEIAVGVACGHYHSLAWTNQGRVFTWGDDRAHALGTPRVFPTDDSPSPLRPPQAVAGLTNVMQAIGGLQYSAVLCDDGVVKEWGGALDIPEVVNFQPAVELEALQILPTHIACGSRFVFIHAGVPGTSELRFCPPLNEEQKAVLAERVHSRLSIEERNNLERLTEDTKLLHQQQRRLKFEKHWNALVLEGSLLEAKSVQAEADPLGTAKIQNTWPILGMTFGIAHEDPRTRARNKRKGKAGLIYTAEGSLAENIEEVLSRTSQPAFKVY